MTREHYEVQVGEQAFPLDSDGDRVWQDESLLDLTVEEVGPGRFSVILDGTSRVVWLEGRSENCIGLRASGELTEVTWKDHRSALVEAMGFSSGDASAHAEVRAPMPGLVLKLMVEEGASVRAGESLAVLEAMKMENELKSPVDGSIARVLVKAGDAVAKGAVLIEFDSK